MPLTTQVRSRARHQEHLLTFPQEENTVVGWRFQEPSNAGEEVTVVLRIRVKFEMYQPTLCSRKFQLGAITPVELRQVVLFNVGEETNTVKTMFPQTTYPFHFKSLDKSWLQPENYKRTASTQVL